MQVQNESNSYPAAPTEVITLDEDEYRYVFNDIPQYFENDMNDLVSNYLTTPEYMPNYTTPNTYSLTNLDAASSMINPGEVIVLDATVNEPVVVEQQQSNEEQFPMPYFDRSTNVDGTQHVIDYDFLCNNKFVQPRTMDGSDNMNFMIVSSEAVPANDILDLTHDDHYIECFDEFPQSTQEPVPQMNKARINVVGNLMRTDFATEMLNDGNHSELNPMPGVDSIRYEDETCVQSTTSDTFGQSKKRSGRPKGARKTCKFILRPTSSIDFQIFLCFRRRCHIKDERSSVQMSHRQLRDAFCV